MESESLIHGGEPRDRGCFPSYDTSWCAAEAVPFLPYDTVHDLDTSMHVRGSTAQRRIEELERVPLRQTSTTREEITEPDGDQTVLSRAFTFGVAPFAPATIELLSILEAGLAEFYLLNFG